MVTCLRQFSGKKTPWLNRANRSERRVIVVEKTEQHKYGQPGSMEYILRSLVSKSADGVVNMAPGTAKRIFDELNFPDNRKLEASREFGHAYAIKTGDWVEDYPIHFSALPDGRIWLVDGQHRISAISKCESPVGVSVRIVDVESEKEARKFYAGFDQKSSIRTNVQILDAVDVAKELGLSNRMARAIYEAAPILLNNLEPIIGSANVKANIEIFIQQSRLKAVTDWAAQAREFAKITECAMKGVYESLRKPGVVAVGLYTVLHQPARAKEFWSGVSKDDGLRKGDPRKALVDDFKTRTMNTGSVRQRVQQSAMAWNAFCEGRDLKVIRCITDSPITLWGTPLNGKAGK